MTMIEKYIERIEYEYPIKQTEIDEFRQIKISSLNGECKAYEVKNLGRVFTMDARSTFGLKRKELFVITPFDIDGPLFCLELNNGKNLTIDFFDVMLDESYNEDRTLAIKNKYSSFIQSRDKAQWSDTFRLKSSMIARFPDAKTAEECLDELLEAYLKALDLAHVSIAWEKKKQIGEFIEGLINNNDEAAETFIRQLGRGTAERFLYEAVFAIR